MKVINQARELSAEQLYRKSNIDDFDFNTTAELEKLIETIGQERAMEAIELGVGMPHDGFNLYVMGSDGLGRHTLVRNALKKFSADHEELSDWCYVANFRSSYNPQYLQVPAGTGQKLLRDMIQLISDLINAIPAAFQSDEYQRRSKDIVNKFHEQEETASQEIGEKAEKMGIALVRDPTGLTLLAQKNGEILTPDQFKQLSKEELQELESAMEIIKADLKEAMGRFSNLQKEMQKALRDLDRETSEFIVSQMISEVKKDYDNLPGVLSYLSEVEQDVAENIDLFRGENVTEEKSLSAEDSKFTRYRVNILVDNSETEGAPIIFEDNPTHQNLVGRVEHFARFGTLQTNFTLIKAGALHRANGGYLVLDADKVLTNPYAWESLKRVIKANEVRIESLERQLSLVSSISLEPQPVPVQLKVILVGSRLLFYLLKAYDPEFGLLFKVLSDLAEDFSRDGESELLYARLIATLQQREGLRDISRDGIELLIEQSARKAEDGEKLSLHLGGLMNLLHEADYHANKSGHPLIGKEDVQRAVDTQKHRVNRIQEQLLEEVLKGTIKIETSGMQLGQINGLSTMQLGDYSFGAPSLISATARIGSGDFIDIERESKQGGSIHSKGVMILTSYLGERYAKHQPLSISASIVFEQTYAEIEGDSASAAELCALMSAIGDVPIKQSIAITGSVNQHGQIQAVGGVCQKIEGFFDLCNARGLSDVQGVIIPSANSNDLMLRGDVVQAVAEGKFHVYVVDHVDQAIELLTGLPAGMPNEEGIYPEGSVNYMIQYRLAEWIALRQHYAGQSKNED